MDCGCQIMPGKHDFYQRGLGKSITQVSPPYIEYCERHSGDEQKASTDHLQQAKDVIVTSQEALGGEQIPPDLQIGLGQLAATIAIAEEIKELRETIRTVINELWHDFVRDYES